MAVGVERPHRPQPGMDARGKIALHTRSDPALHRPQSAADLIKGPKGALVAVTEWALPSSAKTSWPSWKKPVSDVCRARVPDSGMLKSLPANRMPLQADVSVTEWLKSPPPVAFAADSHGLEDNAPTNGVTLGRSAAFAGLDTLTAP